MLQISTVNFNPDDSTVDARHGMMDRGEMQPDAFAALLGQLQAVDPRQNDQFEPRIQVRTALEKFVVRNIGGRLVLYNARDTTQPGAPLDVSGILRAVGVAPSPPGAAEKSEGISGDPIAMPDRRLSLRAALAVVLLTVGLGLNGWSIYAFLREGRKSAAPGYAPVTDAAEIARARAQLAGAYATGTQAGDRAIVITPEFGVLFREFGPAAGKKPAIRFEQTDTGALGRRNGALCLATARYGLIEVQAGGSLRYYGDGYRRIDQ